MMERLTRRTDYDTAVVCDNCPKYGNCNIPSTCLNVLADRLADFEATGLTPEEIKTFYKTISELSGELAKYKEAEKQGRLIVLPCKVGDAVYIIIDGKIHKGEVYHISYSNYYGKTTATVWTRGGVGAAFDHFGKCAFLTREEVEAALEGKNEHLD